MGSVVRTRLLSLDAITGIIRAWSPQVPCCDSGHLGVWALEVGTWCGRLYAVVALPRSKYSLTKIAQFTIRLVILVEDCTNSGSPNDCGLESILRSSEILNGGEGPVHLLDAPFLYRAQFLGFQHK